MNQISALFLSITASLLIPSVEAHGYLTVPKSRNLLASERPWSNAEGEPSTCPHCLNADGRRTTPFVYPETVTSARGHGLCGDAPLGNEDCWTGGSCPEQHHMPDGKFYTANADGVGGAIQATYLEGQHIDVTFTITAHHKGHISLRLCDEADVTQECLDKYEPLRRVEFETGALRDAQPINPEYPELFYLSPTCYTPALNGNNAYEMTGRFALPAGVKCDHCVLQMWWVSANSCVPPGYRNFNFPSTYECDDTTGFYNSLQSDCVGTTDAEEFWNCADISIGDQSATAAATTTITAAATAATTEAPATTTEAPATTTEAPATTAGDNCAPTWSQCGGEGHASLCCEEGSQCFRNSKWYSQCRPSCPADWECSQTPTTTEAPATTTEAPAPTQVWEVQDVCIYDNHVANQFYKSEVGPHDEPMKTASDCKDICLSETDCVGYFYRECTNCLVCMFYNKDQIDSAPTTGCTGNEQFERLVDPPTTPAPTPGPVRRSLSVKGNEQSKQTEKEKSTDTLRSMSRLRGSRQPSNQ